MQIDNQQTQSEEFLSLVNKWRVEHDFSSTALELEKRIIADAVSQGVMPMLVPPSIVALGGSLKAKTVAERDDESGHLLGTGGLGEVYSYLDEETGRTVALKVARPNRELAASYLLVERYVMGLLQHPGVLPIYNVGQLEDGRPFYTMPRVQGQTLYEVIKTARGHEKALDSDSGANVDLTGLVDVLLTVTDVIRFSHSRGVCHNDLKSLNVMIDLDGSVFVVDWGLATVAESSDVSTVESHEDIPAIPDQTHGSPPWMAPEQANLELGPVDALTEVYTAGAMLFEILTGRPPHVRDEHTNLNSSARREKMAWNAIHDSAPDPTRLRSDLPPELVSICRAAMTGDRAQRQRHYPTISALRNDILAWRNGDFVATHSYTPGQRLMRMVRRNPKAAILAAFLAVTTILGALLWQGARSESKIAKLKSRQSEQLAARRYSSAIEAWRTSITSTSEELEAIGGTKELRIRILNAGIEQLRYLIREADEVPGTKLEVLHARLFVAGYKVSEFGQEVEARSELLNILQQLDQIAAGAERDRAEFDTFTYLQAKSDTLNHLFQCDLLINGVTEAEKWIPKLDETLKEWHAYTVPTADHVLFADNLLFRKLQIARMKGAGNLPISMQDAITESLDRNEEALPDLQCGNLTFDRRVAEKARRENPKAWENQAQILVSRDLLYSRSLILDELARHQAQQQDLAAAIETCIKSMQICDEIREQQPTNNKYERGAAISRGQIGSYYRRLEEFDKAVEYLSESVAMLSALSEKFPDDQVLSKELELSIHNQATALRDSGKFEEARQIYLEQLQAAPSDPANADTSTIADIATSLASLGVCESNMGKPSEAFQRFLRCLQLRLVVLKRDNENVENFVEAAIMSRYLVDTVPSPVAALSGVNEIEELVVHAESMLQNDDQEASSQVLGYATIACCRSSELLMMNMETIEATKQKVRFDRAAKFIERGRVIASGIKGMPVEAIAQLTEMLDQAEATMRSAGTK